MKKRLLFLLPFVVLLQCSPFAHAQKYLRVIKTDHQWSDFALFSNKMRMSSTGQLEIRPNSGASTIFPFNEVKEVKFPNNNDPEPEMWFEVVRGYGSATSSKALKSNGQVIETNINGVAADGTTRLEVKFKYISINKNNVPASSLCMSFTVESKSGYQGEGFLGKLYAGEDGKKYYYDAPKEFPQGIKEHEITLKATLIGGGNPLTKKLIIISPPLLLLHGLGDNETCFEEFSNHIYKNSHRYKALVSMTKLLPIPKYESDQMLKVNYSTNNAHHASFEDNKNVVKISLASLFSKYSKKDYIVSKADIIGHSMGGLLARKHVQEIEGGKEQVHKLITLNTPHSGSQMANMIMLEKMQWAGSIAQFHWITGANLGATRDLCVDSKAIEQLNNPDALKKMNYIPIHAVVTDVSKASHDSFCSNLQIIAPWLAYGFIEQISFPGYFYKLFGGQTHDGVVSVISQKGGLADSNISPYSEASIRYYHNNNPKESNIMNRLAELLNKPTTDPAFAKKGFNPVLLHNPFPTYSPTSLTFPSQNANSFIKITASVNEDKSAIVVNKTQSDDLAYQMVMAAFEGIGATAVDTLDTFTVQIPDKFMGRCYLFAFGENRSGAFVKDSLELVIDKRTADLPVSLWFESDTITVLEGMSQRMDVLCKWQSGDTITVPALLTVSNGLVTVSDNYITAAEEGEVTVTATYRGLQATCLVAIAKPAIFIDKEVGELREIEEGELLELPDDAYFARLGDANIDGKRNVTDVVSVANYIIGITPAKFRFSAADMNDDGKVNVSDVVGIVNLILGTEIQAGSLRTLQSGTTSMSNAQPSIVEFLMSNSTTAAYDWNQVEEIYFTELPISTAIVKQKNGATIQHTLSTIEKLYFRTGTIAGTVTDLDGNIYTTVKIGNQEWTVENWKSTKYNDGTTIPLITNNSQWQNDKAGAMCYYNNIEANKAIYGALYNWYAVNTGKMAPAGWRVPSDADWTVLENYLIANGYNYDGTTTGNKIAKAMADVDNAAAPWPTSYTGTGIIGIKSSYSEKNNLSKFSALAAGYRRFGGSFFNLSYFSYFWSSSQGDATNAWNRGLYYYGHDLVRFDNSQSLGFSVRLVRDL